MISGVVIDPNGMDELVKFGDCRSNSSRDIRLPHFVTDDGGRFGVVPKIVAFATLLIVLLSISIGA